MFLNYSDESGSGCVAYQTFNIEKSTGELTFNAAIEMGTPSYQPTGQLTITGNDKFAYSLLWNWGDSETPYAFLSGFKRESDGVLAGMGEWWTGFTETDPKPEPGWEFNPECVNCSTSVDIMAADGTNHLAVALTSYSIASGGYDAGATQLASYTVDNEGNITSTNTWKDMPVEEPGGWTPPSQATMLISPSGKLLAVTTGTGVPLQIFHFNGADPITPYSGALTKLPPTQIGWDNDDHLYAIDAYGTSLCVWTITPTSIKTAPGSPYKVASEGGSIGSLVVVSK